MKILFTFLLFVITTYSYAQEKDKDSIQQLLNSKNDC